MSILEKIKKDMYSAMKSREKDKANTLRGLISSLKNFKIEYYFLFGFGNTKQRAGNSVRSQSRAVPIIAADSRPN